MRQLHNLKLREGASMQDYLLEADKLRNMLRSMGEEISDGELNQIVLDGLPPSYEPTIVALSFLDAPMTFETLFSKLLSEYQRRELRNRLHGDAASFSQQASLNTGWDHWRRAFEVLKMEQGDEFALRKFNPCAYGYEQGVAPREVLTSDPDGCSFVHIDVECWSFALYADGACAGNGTPRARASVGVYSTPDSYYNRGYVLPVHVPHTSQSADIHSAIAALEVARAIVKERWERVPLPDDGHDFTHVLLVMDSSYVVQAMTEWMRNWRVNGFRNARGEPVANQKALMRLDNEIRGLFEEHHIIVRFWLVPRIHNAGADRRAAHALRENTFIGVKLNSDLYEMTERFAQQW